MSNTQANNRLRGANYLEFKNAMGTSLNVGDYNNDPRPLGISSYWPQWTKNCNGVCVPCTWRMGPPYNNCDGYPNMIACRKAGQSEFEDERTGCGSR